MIVFKDDDDEDIVDDVDIAQRLNLKYFQIPLQGRGGWCAGHLLGRQQHHHLPH